MNTRSIKNNHMYLIVLITFSGLCVASKPAHKHTHQNKNTDHSQNINQNQSEIVPSTLEMIEGIVHEEKLGAAGTSAPVLRIENQFWILEGSTEDLRIELPRTTGLKVRIFGKPFDNTHFSVDRYEILEIANGKMPMLGTLAENKEVLYFVEDNGQAHRLPKGFIEKLKRFVGGRLWMTGKEDTEGVFKPLRFSILRPPRAQNSETQGEQPKKSVQTQKEN